MEKNTLYSCHRARRRESLSQSSHQGSSTHPSLPNTHRQLPSLPLTSFPSRRHLSSPLLLAQVLSHLLPLICCLFTLTLTLGPLTVQANTKYLPEAAVAAITRIRNSTYGPGLKYGYPLLNVFHPTVQDTIDEFMKWPEPQNDTIYLTNVQTIKNRTAGVTHFVALGDSMAAGWRYRYSLDIYNPPEENTLWARNFGLLSALNGRALGRPGDVSSKLLWRLQNGELPRNDKKPRVLVLQIGTNDVALKCKRGRYNCESPLAVALRVYGIIQWIRSKQPTSAIAFVGLIPQTIEQTGGSEEDYFLSKPKFRGDPPPPPARRSPRPPLPPSADGYSLNDLPSPPPPIEYTYSLIPPPPANPVPSPPPSPPVQLRRWKYRNPAVGLKIPPSPAKPDMLSPTWVSIPIGVPTKGSYTPAVPSPRQWQVNAILKQLMKPLGSMVSFIDCNDYFLDPEGFLNPALYFGVDARGIPTTLHPSPMGYEVLARCIRTPVTQLYHRSRQYILDTSGVI